MLGNKDMCTELSNCAVWNQRRDLFRLQADMALGKKQEQHGVLQDSAFSFQEVTPYGRSAAATILPSSFSML